MPDCECLPGCPFFNDRMEEKPKLATMYKRHYCQGDNQECARHMVLRALGRAQVPVDLYPNMQDRARQLIAGRP